MLTATKSKTKLSKAELSEVSLRSVLYDRIYDIADRLFKKYNPCNIYIKNNTVQCACKIHTKHRQKSLCCQRLDGINCKYWINGCTVKCLPCKLFTCNAITYEGKSCRIHKKHKVLVKRLRWLRGIASDNGINAYAYFNTKKEVLIRSKRRRGN